MNNAKFRFFYVGMIAGVLLGGTTALAFGVGGFSSNEFFQKATNELALCQDDKCKSDWRTITTLELADHNISEIQYSALKTQIEKSYFKSIAMSFERYKSNQKLIIDAVSQLKTTTGE
jgi:hypothetical protein